MSTQDRIAVLRTRVADPLMAAAVAEVEATAAAALALYVQGDGAAVGQLLGPSATSPANLPLLATMAAAAEAINAAVGDDPTRGYAAIATLHERAGEYRAAADQLIADTPH